MRCYNVGGSLVELKVGNYESASQPIVQYGKVEVRMDSAAHC